MLSNHPAQSSQSLPIEVPATTSKLRILLVDDHAIVRVGLKQMLADAFDRLEVIEVGTGQEAIAKVQEASCDLVILDINLPDTNGLDILKKLKMLRSGLPVVVLSFHPEEQYAVRALKSGASAYVTKDTAPQELAMKASRSCNLSSLVQVAPITTSLWPPRYLVAECMTISAPMACSATPSSRFRS